MLNDKRKTKIVDTKTQLFIALEMMGHALILPLLLVIFLTTDPFSRFLSEETAETHFDAARDFFLLNLGKWPLLLISILFIGFLSIVFSHHIAGPSFRFVKAIRDLKNKDLTHRIKLRRFDYLQNVSLEFNGMLEDLSGEFKSIGSCGKAISDLASKLHEKNPSLRGDLDGIISSSKKIEEIINRYKLNKPASPV